MNIHYLGPPGTFSEKASKTYTSFMGGEYVLQDHDTIRAAAEAVGGQDHIAVLPYYNLLDGTVTDTVDTVLAGGLFAKAIVRLPIRFDAAAQGDLSTVKSVVSHPKALAQCSEFIQSLGSSIKREPVGSTAAAVALAGNEHGVMAIASPEAIAASGLNRLGKDVGDRRYDIPNYTEFLVCRPASDGFSDKELVSGALFAFLLSGETLSVILSHLQPVGLKVEKLMVRPAPPNACATSQAPQSVLLQLSSRPLSRVDFQRSIDEVIKGHWDAVRCVGVVGEPLGDSFEPARA